MSQVIINDVPPYTQAIATMGQTVFSTTWTANFASDVIVYYTPNGTPPDDYTQILAYPADYSVAFIGDQQQVQVTLVTPAAANGDIVTITRQTPADRVNLYSNTNFLPTMLNNDFGILTLVDQQAQLVDQFIAPRYNYSATINGNVYGGTVDSILPILPANETWVKNNGNTAITTYFLPPGGVAPAQDTYVLLSADPGNLPNALGLDTLPSGFMVSDVLGNTILTEAFSGTANQINILNGDGTSGSPVISISSNPIMPGTAGMGIPSGTTAQRVTPGSNISLRFNTTTQSIEYYNGAWIELIDDVVVNPGLINQIAWYAASGTSISGLTIGNNGVLITSNTGVPSWLANGTTNYVLTATAGGSPSWQPVSGSGAVIQIDTDSGNAVSSAGVITFTGSTTGLTFAGASSTVTLGGILGLANGGTNHALTASAGGIVWSDSSKLNILAGTVTAGLPLLSGNAVTPTWGAFGLALGGALTTAGAVTFSGAHTFTGTLTGDTGVTFPTSGTLATTTGSLVTMNADTGSATVSSGALTLSGGSTGLTTSGSGATIDLLGTLAVGYGGTGKTSVTVAPAATSWAGWDANKNMSANSFIEGYTTTATAAMTTTLVVGSTYQQFFTGTTTQTVLLPVVSTLVLGQGFYIVNNSTGVVTVQSSGGNTVQAMAAGTALWVSCVKITGTDQTSWSAFYGFSGGEGSGTVNSGTQYDLAYYATTGTAVSALATANSSVLVTSSGGVPSLSTTLPAALTIPQPSITGVTNASNATAGAVGEFISSVVTSGSPVSVTTATATNVTSISLTAGDWDVWGNVSFIIGGICTQVIGWTDATSASLPDQSSYNNIATPGGVSNLTGFSVPYARYNVSSPTTVYLEVYATFSTSTVTACGGIYARRVR